ncbi:hypothetical protein OUZ56_029622 [Daphnia magna]|uniref:Uncharacterized protein n=1 Tax=Daphnia magna TaxID=35525 RepID=A0ABR0B7E3_9CRUS|nr:hypothetical protein OUZ56_029622 [Daphnia magna]
MDLWPAIVPRQTKLVESKDLIKVMKDQREVVKDRLTIIQQRQKARKGACGKVTSSIRGPIHRKKTIVANVSQMNKFVVESDEESYSAEENEKVTRAHIDSRVACADTGSGLARADTDPGAKEGTRRRPFTDPSRSPPITEEDGESLEDGGDHTAEGKGIREVDSPSGNPTKKRRAPG